MSRNDISDDNHSYMARSCDAFETTLAVRPAETVDIPELVAILNDIIAKGGTTAYQDPISEADLAAMVLDHPDTLFCFVALAPTGQRLGFQWMEHHAGSPGYIATFARQQPKVPGVGSALFEATKVASAQAGLTEIIAKIRADNVPGLAYYSKMGFRDYDVLPDVPLGDGTKVDRILKRFTL